MTGCDPKNIPGPITTAVVGLSCSGFATAAALKLETGITRAITIARTSEARPVEYYDGKRGRLIGREARKFQTWTIAGFLAAQAC